jgi:spore coat polysaccharide biosynthesis protein SpsF
MNLAILQARYSSTRLPGKVLKPLLGVPMILRQLERIKRSARIDKVVVATSVDQSDDRIEQLCRDNGIHVFRGSLSDVLDRFHGAAKPFRTDAIVRLTADCPLADPQLIDRVIDFFLDGGYDYATNALQPTYPDGLDVEVFRASCLEEAWREATLPSEREHVTPFIHRRPERFRIGHLAGETDLSALRWTVDEELDYRLVSEIYAALYPQKPDFGTADVLRLLEERPQLKTMNTKFERNEGMKKSLQADAAYLSTKP